VELLLPLKLTSSAPKLEVLNSLLHTQPSGGEALRGEEAEDPAYILRITKEEWVKQVYEKKRYFSIFCSFFDSFRLFKGVYEENGHVFY